MGKQRETTDGGSGTVLTSLPVAMTGRASPAKAAVGDGWCFACGGFAGHVKVTFGPGTSLTPEPPVTPIGMGKASRGVELASLDDLDERQLASWMQQAAAIPGFGGSRRR